MNKRMANKLASLKCKDEFWYTQELHGFTFIDNTPCTEFEQLTQRRKKSWIPMYLDIEEEIKKPG